MLERILIGVICCILSFLFIAGLCLRDHYRHGYRFVQVDNKGLPTEYRACAYIESDGNQYIDTGVRGGDKAWYEIVFMPLGATKNYPQYFAGEQQPSVPKLFYWSDGDKGVCLQTYHGGEDAIFINGKQYRTVFGDKYENWFGRWCHISVKAHGDVVGNCIAGKFKKAQNEYDKKHNSPTWGAISWYVFASHSEGRGAAMKLAELNMWNGDQCVRKYRPALDETGRPCLFDLVERKAYYNQGTGEFSYKFKEEK